MKLVSHAARRGHHRLVLALLAALTSTVVALLLSGTATPAQASRAPVAPVSSPSCQTSGSSSVIAVGLTNGTKLLSGTDLQVCVTGSLTVTFAGDPATGCAAHGLCGYDGTETWQPGGLGDLNVSRLEHRGRRYDDATIFLGGPGVAARSKVQRSQRNGTTSSCGDRSRDEGGFFPLPVRGSRVSVGLRHADEPFLGTRCAGPLDADIAAALPSRTVALSRILHGRDTIDLTGVQPFAAHGLAGTVRSTIVLRLGRPRRSSGSHGSSPPPGVKPTRVATVNYRVTDIEGSAEATVRTSPLSAVCSPFDACGLQGTLDVTPGQTSIGSAGLIATAPLSRPKRDLLAALGVGRRGNPSGIRVEGGGIASGHGEISADLTQPGGACRDQTGLGQVVLELRKRADRLDVSLSPGASAAGPLRTRCPGPALGSHQLTSAALPLTVLRHPTFTAKLEGESFSNGPYQVTTRSTLTVTLRRTRVSTRILPFMARSRSRAGLTDLQRRNPLRPRHGGLELRRQRQQHVLARRLSDQLHGQRQPVHALVER
jgi:hypothetical protein